MAQLLNIVFKKNDPYTSWGFQVCGGRDSWRPLTVRHVQDETLAANYLNVDDRVLEIDGIDCYSLTESQAIAFLRRPSTCIELLVLKRRGGNVVPPKRSSSCKALKNFTFPKQSTFQSISKPCTLPEFQYNLQNGNTELNNFTENSNSSINVGEPPKHIAHIDTNSRSEPHGPFESQNACTDFSNFRPRRNSFQKDSEPVRLRSRSNSPQFWKLRTESSTNNSNNDCRHFWKKLEKCSLEDLTVRHTPSPVRPASVAFYSKTPELFVSSSKSEVVSKKKVSFSNVLKERNYLQMDMPDLSPGSKVDEEFNKIYNRSKQEEQHQVGVRNSTGDMSAPPPPPPMPCSGGTVQGGPPPPPPMLHSGHIPAIRIKTELNEQPKELPSAIQNAMATKDKKPFTYLPGGLDLSEIKSPRMQRRLERNAQTPPTPEQILQKSPDYQQQQQQYPILPQQQNYLQQQPQQYHLPQPQQFQLPQPQQHQQQQHQQLQQNQQPQQYQLPQQQSPAKTNIDQKPVCNVRPAAERVCLLPQVQQPHLNKAPTPWLQKVAQPQQNHNLAPWAQNRNENVDQVDRPAQERVIPLRVEPVRQPPPMKNNLSHSYDAEPIQGRSFKVLQQITQEPKGIYDGTQPYNSQALPLSELRKLNLNDDDRSLMNKVKTQISTDNGVQHHSVPITHYVSEPVESKIYVPPSERPTGVEPHKYTGGSIPSRSFKMLQAMTGQNNEEENQEVKSRKLPLLAPYFYSFGGFCHLKSSLQEFYEHEPKNKIDLSLCPTSPLGEHEAHMLNTIDEEDVTVNEKSKEKKLDENRDKGNQVSAKKEKNKNRIAETDCEITVTITLPKMKTTGNKSVNAKAVRESPVDFWRQINDDRSAVKPQGEQQHNIASVNQDVISFSETEDDASPSYLLLDVKDHDLRRKSEDADSGITSDISHQTSEKDVSGPKKYHRTCTHSRLFDFLREDDVADDMQITPMTASGYSSTATTPSTPALTSVHNANRTDSGTEYDDYYKSWEFTCPYDGYDILPSKAFKTIQGASVKTTTKFKCPKIPIHRPKN
ncbi:probable global transcription activator SNF2L2 isoform X2 [Adelges cooleyi]|uniref:probable global transcription activator SNF2L2 isoform X2 n=1 Tax=Adelges cooleyi TaxID=133065 RepID=UPI00217FCB5B|nr:probable global transcription activator SNF2L2 isoform X2 [Adelges cooleyi]